MKVAAETLTVEMWPDMSEYSEEERFAVPGFTHPDGSQAYLFSSENEKTVLRHFQWMRDYGIDGAWLQHFLVALPNQSVAVLYESRMRVLNHAKKAANATGRIWAISYDLAGMPPERIYEALTEDWKKLVDSKFLDDPQYLHEQGKPVVQIWGFYDKNDHNPMSVELANRLIDFFKTPGPYAAFLVGGGDWDWRQNPNPDWRKFVLRFDAYVPWNIGNYTVDGQGDKHASTHYWEEDRKLCEENGVLWIPTVYPGFSWDNLLRLEPGTSLISRRDGLFLWEQFVRLSEMKQTSVYLAMFDEVDEGTAIFKVLNAPPLQGHFVGRSEKPTDWYLQIVREGSRLLHSKSPDPADCWKQLNEKND